MMTCSDDWQKHTHRYPVVSSIARQTVWRVLERAWRDKHATGNLSSRRVRLCDPGRQIPKQIRRTRAQIQDPHSILFPFNIFIAQTYHLRLSNKLREVLL